VRDDVAAKVALFCDVDARAVVPLLTVDTIYRVPLILEDAHLGEHIVRRLGLSAQPPNLTDWRALVERLTHPSGQVSIGVVGKYVELPDAYLSVKEALIHAGVHHGVDADVNWIQAETLEHSDVDAILAGLHGIVVPGGFGERGLEGKILAAQYARERGVPYLGLCLGMQMMVIEYARNVLGWKDAHTTEVEPETGHPVISLLSEQQGITDLGGTMRLGNYLCRIRPGTLAAQAYDAGMTSERHRHRWEFNNAYKEELEAAGLIPSGTLPDGSLVEICEVRDHPFMIGSQFHPELRSRPTDPHPLFRGFIAAAVDQRRGWKRERAHDEDAAGAASALR